MKTIFSPETLASMEQYFNECKRAGFDEGLAGVEYTGRTFIGYYSYLDGCEARNLRAA